MKKITKLLIYMLCISYTVIVYEPAFADTTRFTNLQVISENESSTTDSVKKDDTDPAVGNILSGLEGFNTNIVMRVRSTYDGNAASKMVWASDNGRYTLIYLPDYGNYGSYYRLNMSLQDYSWKVSVTGRFSP